MAPARRRVTYVIPPPSESVPRLQLPPHGASKTGSPAPLIIHRKTADDVKEGPPPKWAQHPRHRLGVNCLALDTSTQLLGRNSPEGILYSGGRDGLLVSWDLGIPMKKRTQRYGASSNGFYKLVGRWESMTGWADDIVEEDAEDGEELRSDGDILGEVKEAGGRRGRKRKGGMNAAVPFEEQWETDVETFQPNKGYEFRQCVQAHSDWVNDILLCNYNQTVVSASSDGTLKAWSPHAAVPSEPTTIGMHEDYARCLSLCREQRWVASGSFDRTIKLWDLARGNNEPLMTLHPPEQTGPKASVYALASDPYGYMIASGSPERVIRMWDPRSGKRIGKLVGHTDNIRAILISEDAKYLLTGSADASIKLWSLSTQRCLHTFTHHTDSVWSLHSQHPSLEIFYSGDRTGLVCKVDVEGCSDVSEGECVVVCQDTDRSSFTSTEGVNKIVAMDDNALWTASGSSSIKRWKAPSKRQTRATSVIGVGSEEMQSPTLSSSPNSSPRERDWSRRRSPDYTYTNSGRRLSAEFHRGHPHSHSHSHSPSPSAFGHQPRNSMAVSISDTIGPTIQQESDREGEETWYGIPYESLVKLNSPNEMFTSFSRGRDPEIATLYSAASVMSVPHLVRSPLSSVFTSPNPPRAASPFHDPSRGYTETLHPVRTARAEFEEREVASDAVPLYTTPEDTIHGDHGLVRSAVLNDRIHALTVDTAGEVAVWDLVRGTCIGRFSSGDVAAASFNGSMKSGETEGECERSPREALEIVKERIEGEAVVVPWAAVDTKTGLLTVHLTERCFEAEVYADEMGYNMERHGGDEVRLNIGRWVLRNLFHYFIREEQRMAARRAKETAIPENHRLHRGGAPIHIEISNGTIIENRPRSSSLSSKKSSPQLRNAIVISSPNMLPALTPTAATPITASSPLITPMVSLTTAARDSGLTPIPQSPLGAANGNDATPMPRRSATIDLGSTPEQKNDYFSLRTRRPSVSLNTNNKDQPPVPQTPDDFSSFGSSTPKPIDTNVPATPSTPSGLMGRLKAFGKTGRRATIELGSGTPQATADIITDPKDILSPSPPKTPLQSLLSNPITPPPSSEAPALPLAHATSIIISEEASSGWVQLYKGQLSGTGHDAKVLEETMPFWLLECLLLNRIPTFPLQKMSFVLVPYTNKNGNGEQLPELLNTAQSKLTASRFLRVKKLTQHVQDKIDRLTNSRPVTASNTPRSSIDSRSVKSRDTGATGLEPRPRAEEQYEILCNDVVLSLDMTLAAIRQYIWRSSAELVMQYRRKATSAAGTPTPPSKV